MNRIRHFVGRKQKVAKGTRVFTMGSGPSWFKIFSTGGCPGGTIHGWMLDKPKVGDIILSEMASGNTGEFQVTTMKHFCDPPDQFIGDVSLIGIVGTHDFSKGLPHI